MPGALTHDQLQRIHYILDEIQRYTATQWMTSELLRHVVMRKLQLLSQMINRLPVDLKDQYPDVNWQRLLSFRRSAVHTFLSSDLAEIAQMVQHDIPTLIRAIDSMLSPTTALTN